MDDWDKIPLDFIWPWLCQVIRLLPAFLLLCRSSRGRLTSQSSPTLIPHLYLMSLVRSLNVGESLLGSFKNRGTDKANQTKTARQSLTPQNSPNLEFSTPPMDCSHGFREGKKKGTRNSAPPKM